MTAHGRRRTHPSCGEKTFTGVRDAKARMRGMGTSTEERPAAALTGVDTRVGLAATPSPDRRGQTFGWLVIGMGLLTACATMPPERAARRALLEKAATDCQRRFPVVTKVAVDSFDRIVATRWEDTPQTALDPFWQGVRDRTRELERASPAASPGASTARDSPGARRELDEAGSADEAKVAAYAKGLDVTTQDGDVQTRKDIQVFPRRLEAHVG